VPVGLTHYLLAQAQSARLASDVDAVGQAIAIATAGILIVFSALILISLFIAALPRILGLVAHVWPETSDWRHEESHPESQAADDGDVLAAIGFVLHTEIGRYMASKE